VTTDEGNSMTLLAWYGVVGTVYVKNNQWGWKQSVREII